MKICVLGNCQSVPLRKIIDYFVEDAEVPFIKQVHLFNKDDVFNLYKELENADLLITQRINDDYSGFPIGTNQLKKKFSKSCRIIVVPNAHFDGYFPSFVYLKDDKNRSISPRIPQYSSMFSSDYHEGFCIAAKIKKLSMNNLIEFYSAKDSLRKAWSEYWFDDSLDNLLSREIDADFGISDYISENARDRQLFWTFNHPANELLIHIVKKSLLFGGVKFKEKKIDKEFLAETIFPIFPSTIANLNINFSPRLSTIEGDDWLAFLKKCWNSYDNIPDILLSNSNSRKINDFLKYIN